MNKEQAELDKARELVSEAVAHDKETVPNTVSDDTGDLDPRFALWRAFCTGHGVPVETLPGDLNEQLRGEWEGFKEEEIHKTEEGRT